MRSAAFLFVVAVLATAGSCKNEPASRCAELAERCHGLGDEGLEAECHETGHRGDEGACEEIYDECIAHCVGSRDAGPTDGGTDDAGVDDAGGLDDGGQDSGGDAGLPGQTHRYALDPGDAAESTLDLDVGTIVTMSFESTEAVDWDVHTHFGATEVLRSGSGTAAEETFTAERAGDHFLFWDNVGGSTAIVDVTVTLDGPGTVSF